MTTTTTTTTTTSTTVSTSVQSGGCCGPEEAPSTQRTADGSVQFENENYRITVGDNNEVKIYNKQTGESYRIWGDPHVEIDGQQAFDFWGQTTFVLDDGTKVTIGTTPWEEGSNGATVASEVTITDGDYTAHITGVDTNTHGDLSFVEYETGGMLVDLAVDDGNTIYENSFGSGFIGVDAEGNLVNVDQAFINGTDLIVNDDMKLAAQQFLQWYSLILSAFGSLSAIVITGSFVFYRTETTTTTTRNGNTTTTTTTTETTEVSIDSGGIEVNQTETQSTQITQTQQLPMQLTLVRAY